MNCSDFQFIDNPFRRSTGYGGVYVEEISSHPTIKPYFKGTDIISADYPSPEIRIRVKECLKGVTSVSSENESYKGNMTTSKLHEFEEMERRMKEVVTSSDYEINTVLKINLDSSFQSVTNCSEKMTVLDVFDQQYLIPSECGFYNGNIDSFIQNGIDMTFDIIEIDPPWPCKSVNRAGVYNKRYKEDDMVSNLFSSLPLSSLCNDGCLILVWITNNPSCMEKVMLFFAEQEITHMTTAYWVKVTESKQPVVPLSCPTRETFERVVVGKYMKHDPSKRMKVSVDPLTWSLTHYVKQLTGKQKGVSCSICDHYCCSATNDHVPFIVTPVSFHSRKPNCELFSFISLPPNYHGLELFARQLRPKWYSVGNEVLLFQNSCLFVKSGIDS